MNTSIDEFLSELTELCKKYSLTLTSFPNVVRIVSTDPNYWKSYNYYHDQNYPDNAINGDIEIV